MALSDLNLTNPDFVRSIAMLRGQDPNAAVKEMQDMMLSQAQTERATQQVQNEKASRAILAKAAQGGLTDEMINQLFAIDPELAIKMQAFKRKQQQDDIAQSLILGGGGAGLPQQPAQPMQQTIDDDGLPSVPLPMGQTAQPDYLTTAKYGALTGNKDLMDLAKMQQDIQEKSPERLADIEERKALAKDRGERLAVFNSTKAKMPEIIDTVNKLSKLGKKATYTNIGQARDWAARQAGYTTEGATARTEYETTVANQMLPLLRDTFGAQFTAAEGERLLATLGDLDVTPEQKDAALRSFITQKANDIKSTARQFGKSTDKLDELMNKLSIGEKQATKASSSGGGWSIRRLD